MKRFTRHISLIVVALLAPLCCVAAELPPPSSAAFEAPPSLADLRHAVLCPPFSGEEPFARLYHDALVRLLKESHNVCVLDPASTKKLPVFHYRIDGSVSLLPNGSPSVSVCLVDVARGDVIADYTAPASTNKTRLAEWCRVVRNDVKRRVRHIPFECSARRHIGQDSLTLDRGADAGLLPRMILYISDRGEPLIDHATGRVLGHDTPRTFGQVVVFRVTDRTAYVRPLYGTTLPRRANLFVRSF